MTTLATVTTQCAVFVTQLFEDADTSKLYYHNYEHTKTVVQNVRQLSAAFSTQEQYLLQIAAWMHDIGYLEAYDKHEQRGMRIASDFLADKLEEESIEIITACIEATTVGLEPRNELEATLKDADIACGIVGDFKKSGDALRKEWRHYHQKTYTDQAWKKLQLDFLQSMHFYNHAARNLYTPMLKRNLEDFEC